MFLSKNPWQFLRNAIISNLYWHQLKSMIRGECDPITFTRTATASAALVVGIEPNPKNTSLWKMAKSHHSDHFCDDNRLYDGLQNLRERWWQKMCVFTEEGHAMFCFAGVRPRNFGYTLIWCSGVQTISGRWVPHSEYHLVHHWTEPYNGTRAYWCQNPDIDSRLSRIRLTKPRWRVQELLTQQGLSTISWPKCLILIWLLCVTYCCLVLDFSQTWKPIQYCNYIRDCGSSWIICFWHHYWTHTSE